MGDKFNSIQYLGSYKSITVKYLSTKASIFDNTNFPSILKSADDYLGKGGVLICSTAHAKSSISICAVYTKWAQLQEKAPGNKV